MLLSSLRGACTIRSATRWPPERWLPPRPLYRKLSARVWHTYPRGSETPSAFRRMGFSIPVRIDSVRQIVASFGI